MTNNPQKEKPMERMWYYMHENRQMGPVSQVQLTDLLQQGIIQKGTYVWTEGMADWQPAAGVDFVGGTIHVAPPKRPTSVTVFGTINIVFGVLGLLCSPLGIIGLLIPNPGGPMDMYPAGMKIFLLFSYAFGMFMSVILLVCGIGLLNLKRWARQTSFIYGWFAIIWGVLSTVITLAVLGTSLSGANQEAMPAAIGGIVGGACGGLVGLIYPIFLVVYMRRPNVIAACTR
jgi:hypothetical protein